MLISYGRNAVDPLVTSVNQEVQKAELLMGGCCFDHSCFWCFDHHRSRSTCSVLWGIGLLPCLELATCPRYTLPLPQMHQGQSPVTFARLSLRFPPDHSIDAHSPPTPPKGPQLVSPVPVLNMPTLPELHVWWMNLRDWLPQVVLLLPVRPYEGEWLF